jgi:hypothetical protein
VSIIRGWQKKVQRNLKYFQIVKAISFIKAPSAKSQSVAQVDVSTDYAQSKILAFFQLMPL